MPPPAAYPCNDKTNIQVAFEGDWKLSDDTSVSYTENKCTVTGKDSRATLTTTKKAAHLHGAGQDKLGIWGCQLDDEPIQWFDGTDMPVGSSIRMCSIGGFDGQAEHRISITTGTTDDGSLLGLSMFYFDPNMQGGRQGDGKTFESDGAPVKSGAPDQPKTSSTKASSSTTATGTATTGKMATGMSLHTASNVTQASQSTSDGTSLSTSATRSSSESDIVSTTASSGSSAELTSPKETDSSPSSSNNDNTTTYVIAGVVVVLAVCALAAFLFMRRRQSSDNSDYDSVGSDESDEDSDRHSKR